MIDGSLFGGDASFEFDFRAKALEIAVRDGNSQLPASIPYVIVKDKG
ncbi:MAG: hypothetical protein ABIR84_00975 [Candidatus Nitrotoga sp.]